MTAAEAAAAADAEAALAAALASGDPDAIAAARAALVQANEAADAADAGDAGAGAAAGTETMSMLTAEEQAAADAAAEAAAAAAAAQAAAEEAEAAAKLARDTASVTTIQASARRRLAAAKYRLLVQIVEEVNSAMCAEVAQEAMDEAIAAGLIQGAVRAKFGQRAFEGKRMAAAVLQRRMRTMLAMRLLERQRQSALLMQSAQRRKKATDDVAWRRARQFLAVAMQARYRGHRVRAIRKCMNDMIQVLEDAQGETNQLVNAAIAVQRAYHTKQARKATLARTTKLNDFYTVRACRVVQRQFRKTPDRIVAQVLRGLCSGVVMLSVSHSAETNAARRINACCKALLERRRAERLAAKRAREDERMHLLLSVNLGQRDTTKSVPWSTYARKAAHHSVAEDGGLSLYGGPPRRSARLGSDSSVQVKKFGGLTSVVPRAPRGSGTSLALGHADDPSGGSGYHHGGEGTHGGGHYGGMMIRRDDPHNHSAESLTELLPGQEDLLPTFRKSRPPAPAAAYAVGGAGGGNPYGNSNATSAVERSSTSAVWNAGEPPPLPPPDWPQMPHHLPQPPPRLSGVGAGGHKTVDPVASAKLARARRLRLADPTVLTSIYSTGPEAQAAAAAVADAERLALALEPEPTATPASLLPRLVAGDLPGRESELLGMYGLSPRNRLTAGYTTSAYERAAAAEGLAATGGPRYSSKAAAAAAAGAYGLAPAAPPPPSHTKGRGGGGAKDSTAVYHHHPRPPPVPRKAWGSEGVGAPAPAVGGQRDRSPPPRPDRHLSMASSNVWEPPPEHLLYSHYKHLNRGRGDNAGGGVERLPQIKHKGAVARE
jgi:hypothetical protein